MINCIDEDGHLYMYGGWSNVIIAGGLGLGTFKKSVDANFAMQIYIKRVKVS